MLSRVRGGLPLEGDGQEGKGVSSKLLREIYRHDEPRVPALSGNTDSGGCAIVLVLSLFVFVG